MPDVTVEIGGRDFSVACQDGEEAYLQAAARLLNTEAEALIEQVGRMPTERMLLMAGLMLADKTAALEEDMAGLQSQVETQDQALIDRAHQIAALEEAQGPDTVAVIPLALKDHLAELAARVEALAEELDADEDDGQDA